MITAKELERITSTYGVDGPEIIPIEGEDYMERIGRGRYILHRPDGDFHVKGIGWGHGHLFIFTAERGTTGISYPHEPIAPKYTEDDQEGDDCEQASPQRTLDAWMVAQ